MISDAGFIFFLLFCVSSGLTSRAQNCSIQVYCPEGFYVYADGQFKGKTRTEMSGLLLENQSCDSVSIRVYRSGYEMVEKSIKTSEDHAEVKFDSSKESQTIQILWVGANMYGGAFGLFNVDNVFTKAKYSVGASIYSDYHFHRNFSLYLNG
ncbi:MAG TPA: hypothetical protein DEP18_07695 [Flavobacteriales bacterium]|nr:hypothetical protein [Flavobacteriales bacterium]HCA83655.1 hypothetical protein [Flavobacteriales bacterium]